MAEKRDAKTTAIIPDVPNSHWLMKKEWFEETPEKTTGFYDDR